MRNIRAVVILAFLILTTVSASEPTPPTSIHLELSKNNLALAEPVYLKATITNLSDNDLVINKTFMFGIEDLPNFLLFLITPNEDIWRYHGRGLFPYFGPDSKLYFLLPPEEQITGELFLWWQLIVPPEYRYAYENLPHGNYRLYATYRIPGPKEFQEVVIYSDTAEFVFLPPEEKHLQTLRDIDSLRLYDGTRVASPILERIKNSNTPYSEAAWAQLISWIKEPELYILEKASFDVIYPETQFASYLMLNQISLARKKGLIPQIDSILPLWKEETPSPLYLIGSGLEEGVKTLTEKERREQ
ncbi:MAG: hypothetical protein U9Q76_03900 [candidate division WOR-3 bacterium]|nr:hypothetical protein [candidate division WOR-3 bacterium]